MKRVLKVLAAAVFGLLALITAFCFISQALLDHSGASFTPDYERVTLTADTDPETLFLQTGLSPAAVAAVIQEKGVEEILEIQEAFFAEKQVECSDVFIFFTQQDILLDQTAAPFASLEPGDIIISLSPHSIGWRHGHGALAMDDTSILQLTAIGTTSQLFHNSTLRDLSQYAVLRLRTRPEGVAEAIAAYAEENLLDVPYSVLGGFFGEKAPSPDDPDFSLLCTSLVWYAYYQLGYDIDSDGGRYVSAQDILDSPLLEVVQVYGMDPRDFLERAAGMD